jgi:hypothetical protein
MLILENWATAGAAIRLREGELLRGSVLPGAKVEPCCGLRPGVTATIANLGDRQEKEDISGRDERIVACND